MKVVRVVANPAMHVCKSDAEHVSIAAELLRAYKVSGALCGEMQWIIDRSGISRRRLYALLRKYLPRIAVDVGAKGAVYFGADKTVTGRGAFGRLGGSGDRSKHNPPRLRFDYE